MRFFLFRNSQAIKKKEIIPKKFLFQAKIETKSTTSGTIK